MEGVRFVARGNGAADENVPIDWSCEFAGAGALVTNLGVHEHWNNSIQKLYGRNLGKDEGIELVQRIRQED